MHKKSKHHQAPLKSSWINTPLGPMFTISDNKELYLLEFGDRRALKREIEKLQVTTQSPILPGTTEPINSIENELKLYFEGKLKEFKTPLHLAGSPFQQQAWHSLIKIPYGETRSYSDQATLIGKETAVRAIANANGANQIAIVIPCHRIIRSNGDLGGYGGGLDRKKWLLEHEKQNLNN